MGVINYHFTHFSSMREDGGHTMTFGNVTTQADVSRSILSWIIDVERSSILIARQHPESRWEFVDGFILLPDLLDTAPKYLWLTRRVKETTYLRSYFREGR